MKHRLARRVRLLAAVAAVGAGTLVCAASAAASAPRFEPAQQEVHSTRVWVLTGLFTGELHTEFQIAYAESPSGPWIVTESSSNAARLAPLPLTLSQETDETAAPGIPRGDRLLRHLKPGTQYYGRFVAKNEAGEATELVPFKTLPVEKPEIRRVALPEQFSLTTFRAAAEDAHSISLAAQVEANGAATTYQLEYAPFELGPWTVCGSGSISLAQEFADPRAECTGLMPETTYFVRVKASNEKGVIEQAKYEYSDREFSTVTTPTAKPQMFEPEASNVTATSADVKGQVLPHGSETHWRLEYETSLGKLERGEGLKGPEGAVSQAQAEALPFGSSVRAAGKLTGLAPASVYYVRIFAENKCATGCGSATGPIAHFETSGPPVASTFATHALHGESLRLIGAVNPDSVPTTDEQTIAVEGAPTGGTFALTFNGQSTGGTATGTLTSGSSTVSGIPLSPVKGTGTVLVRHGGALGEVIDVAATVGRFHRGEVISGPDIPPNDEITEVTGTTLELSQDATGFVSGAQLTSTAPSPFSVGEVVTGAGIPAGTTVTGVRYAEDFTATLTLSASATASGSVALSGGLPFNASANVVGEALEALPSEPHVTLRGSAGGPYAAVFTGPDAERAQPQIEGDGAGLTPSGAVAVAVTQAGGEAYDAHYHFDYERVQEGVAPFTQATATASLDAGSGGTPKVVGVDVPGLQPGASYRYRLVATSTSPGNPVVAGGEQTVRVPTPAPAAPVSCANQALRTGASANLPDCRAYEQLTPADKEGTQEPFDYSTYIKGGALAGESGEQLVLEAEAVNWGHGATAGHGPYFFSRSPGGWLMTAAGIEPEAGVREFSPQVFDPNVTRFGFSSGFRTAPKVLSEDLEFRVGSPGGPYTTVASVPRKQVAGKGEGWVAASADFSRLILQVEDRNLVEPATTTVTGADLYEYSGGELRQVNVGVGTCGARIARGAEPAGVTSSAHSVSADGSRVFFEAVPGSSCANPLHLYMRVGGAQTVDLGAGRFLAANQAGSQVLLERVTGEAHELFLYETENATSAHLLTLTQPFDSSINIHVSTDLSAIYFSTPEALTTEAPAMPFGSLDVYRYDVPGRALRFLFEVKPPNKEDSQFGGGIQAVSPDGRYAYLELEELAGVPGGAKALRRDGAQGPWLSTQVYRYDSAENVVECVSCASTFDPEPRLKAFLETADHAVPANGGLPTETPVSADGNYAFFTTPAALVREDVDGDIPPPSFGEAASVEGQFKSIATSASSDVYEWRRDGVSGCVQLQGCLALITNGRGGHFNLLLGTADDGRDVFIYTYSQLVPQDRDAAGDIYDVRIGGGFPPPPPAPVECEADFCSTPAGAPNDATPSSFTFSGAGNLLQPAPPVPVVQPSHPKPKHKHKKAKRRHRGRKATRRPAATRRSGRSGR
jgi:hypothetical protein